MEIKSLLIKDTTKEERIRIVQEGLNQCGGGILGAPYLIYLLIRMIFATAVTI